MVDFRTLGSLELRREGREVSTILSQPKRLALLAWLAAARPHGFHARETLLARFWPESDDERARNALRQALHHLRRSLGQDVVVGRGEREVGVDPVRLRCDAAAFDDAIEAGRWDEALGLYRGEFLPGLVVQDAPEVERWIEDERARRRRAAVDAARRLAEAAATAGDLRAAERWQRAALAHDPADEGALRELLALLERAGDMPGALGAFDDFSRRLREDHGAAPAAATQALVARLRAGAVAPPATAVPSAGAQPARDVPLPEPPAAAGAITAPPAGTAWAEAPGPALPGPALHAPAAPQPRRALRHRLLPALVASLVLAFAAGMWWRTAHPAEQAVAGAAAREPSIAVLPFVNMSGDPANEWFSEGLTEELLNLLAQAPGLQVAARTSAFSFKGRNVPVDSIGRALRVRHVVEGSVRAAGKRVRITAQLIDATTGYHLWSRTYDRELTDVLAVQDAIARSIVDVLRPSVAGPTPPLAAGDGVAPPDPAGARAHTRDPEAHAAVLRGWRALALSSREGTAAAVAQFETATRRDSGYARAWGGLSSALLLAADRRYLPPETYGRARSAARRALALDSATVEAEIVLGRHADAVERDDAAAERHFRRAIALGPSDARAWRRWGYFLANRHRDAEALAAARRGIALDPASPDAWGMLAYVHRSAKRLDSAAAGLRAALAVEPGHAVHQYNLALLYDEMGRLDDARRVLADARRRRPDEMSELSASASIYAKAGFADSARTLLRQIERNPEAKPYDMAIGWARLRDTARTLALLDHVIAEGGQESLLQLTDSGEFAFLRGVPAYVRLQRRLAAARRPAR
jgi:TolB-like protein/DNA-binding SARP family transcriptional activator/Flp pilus assembly protein TadD